MFRKTNILSENTEVYNLLCDSLEIEPRPNNGTLRLPLKPIGLHSDPEALPLEDPHDPPATGVSIPANTPSPATEESPPPSNPTASHTTSTPPTPADEDDAKETPDKDQVSSLLDDIFDTIGSFKDWVSGIFGSDDSDDGEED